MDIRSSQEEARTKAAERCRRLLEQDPDLRRSAPSAPALARLRAEGLSSLGRFMLACELYADRPCFGERSVAVVDGEARALPTFRHTTFAQLWGRVGAMATGMARFDLAGRGTFVGIAGFPSVEGVVVDLACLYLAAVSVPLSTLATGEELAGIVTGAGISTVVCSVERLEVVAGVAKVAPALRAIGVVGLREGVRAHAEVLARVRERIGREAPAVRVVSMAEVERGGEGTAAAPVDPVPDDALRTLVYTSGSTGAPKGAMFTERVWSLYWQRSWEMGFEDMPCVTVGYMPQNHVAGRWAVLRSIISGGLTSFVSSPDMSTLFEDIRLARPTTFLCVPRVANLIYQRFQTRLMHERITTSDGAAEARAMADMRRSFLGDRLLELTTGSAPTAREVVDFLVRCFEVPVIDGYGLTEVGVLSVDGRIDRENVLDYRVVDVPELGYTARDRPYPRGELCVKTRRLVSGYFRSPDATRKSFDGEGFYCTGDIVEQRGPEEIAWIDRKKNVLKLAQGEFVSVSRLEELYVAGSPFIAQMYLHGSSLWSYLLAVVVPAGAADKALLRSELDRVAKREGLQGFEVPRDFIVETSPFTREGGLLTDSAKPSRPKLRARYGPELDAMHAEIERRQLDDLQKLETDRGLSVAENVSRAFAVTLGLTQGEVRATEQSFLKLGGDSLGAVELVSRIRDLCGVDLPVAMVLDPTSNPQALIHAVEERAAGQGAPGAQGRGRARMGEFAEVHGAGAQTVRAEDLRVDRFIPSGELAAAANMPPTGRALVVLTGANGFLGRFLLLELLERVAPAGGKVVAIVRARDDGAARERLAASYTLVDPKIPGARADARLAARFAELSEAGLEVFAGDLVKPRLGLAHDLWDRLASEVTSIVHPGALVNHALGYAQLFDPNVLGTVEIMRLSLRRRAPIGFVSTVGVGMGVDRADPLREEEDAEALWRERPVDSGYAVGYSTSKWAGEILGRDLEARARVPVSVFRASMMMPPESFDGPLNADDMLTRILLSVAVTGLAPRSFYAPTATRRHFDGLPVDVVARAIAAVSLAAREGFATYHVVDGHVDDGVSLDTFVDWVERAGHPIQRIEDHGEWLRAFRERLEKLTPAEQQHSALAALKAWERPLGREVGFDNRLLRRRLRALGESAEMPPIDERAIQRYLRNLAAAGLIPR